MATKSSLKRYTQTQLTKIFLTAANLPIGKFSELRYDLWFNPKGDHSIRLSMNGYKFVCKILKIESYEFPLTEPLTNYNLLQLDRYFQTMYYILNNKKFFLFDESEASMLSLMGGDLKTYLDNLEINT